MITDLSHNETLIPQSAENRLKLVFVCVCVSVRKSLRTERIFWSGTTLIKGWGLHYSIFFHWAQTKSSWLLINKNVSELKKNKTEKKKKAIAVSGGWALQFCVALLKEICRELFSAGRVIFTKELVSQCNSDAHFCLFNNVVYFFPTCRFCEGKFSNVPFYFDMLF